MHGAQDRGAVKAPVPACFWCGWAGARAYGGCVWGHVSACQSVSAPEAPSHCSVSLLFSFCWPLLMALQKWNVNILSKHCFILLHNFTGAGTGFLPSLLSGGKPGYLKYMGINGPLVVSEQILTLLFTVSILVGALPHFYNWNHLRTHFFGKRLDLSISGCLEASLCWDPWNHW